jgi:hypothetical protein
VAPPAALPGCKTAVGWAVVVGGAGVLFKVKSNTTNTSKTTTMIGIQIARYRRVE